MRNKTPTARKQFAISMAMCLLAVLSFAVLLAPKISLAKQNDNSTDQNQNTQTSSQQPQPAYSTAAGPGNSTPADSSSSQSQTSPAPANSSGTTTDGSSAAPAQNNSAPADQKGSADNSKNNFGPGPYDLAYFWPQFLDPQNAAQGSNLNEPGKVAPPAPAATAPAAPVAAVKPAAKTAPPAPAKDPITAILTPAVQQAFNSLQNATLASVLGNDSKGISYSSTAFSPELTRDLYILGMALAILGLATIGGADPIASRLKTQDSKNFSGANAHQVLP